MKLRALLTATLLISSAFVTRSDAQQTPRGRGAVVSFSALYTSSALAGAFLSIRDSLPEAPFGWHSATPPRKAFLMGTGTALSPGLPMLVLQAAATALVVGPERTARTGARCAHGGGFGQCRAACNDDDQVSAVHSLEVKTRSSSYGFVTSS